MALDLLAPSPAAASGLDYLYPNPNRWSDGGTTLLLPTPTPTDRAPLVPAFASLPTGWDDVWREALAASDVAPARVTILGDSIAQGGVNAMALAFWPRLIAWVLTRYPLGAHFWGIQYSPQYTSSLAGTPWTLQATAGGKVLTWLTNRALGRLPTWQTAAAVDLATFLSPIASTDLDLISMDRTAGTWTYAIDGGAPVTVTNTASGDLVRIQITGLANTVHTVVFGHQSADNVCTPVGVATYQSRTSGLHFGWCAYSGGDVWGWTRWLDGIHNVKRWAGWQPSTDAATGFGFPTQPHLLICNFGINDMSGGGLGLDQFTHGLRQIVQSFRRGRERCSMLWILTSVPDEDSSDAFPSAFNNVQDWPFYLQRIQSIARDFGIATVNIHDMWGETPVAKGYMTDNGGTIDLHPSADGHGNMFALLQQVLP